MASRSIAASARVNEFSVNDALKAWLGGIGAMIQIEYVEMRRTLLDYGLRKRDSRGKQYWKRHTLADARIAA